MSESRGFEVDASTLSADDVIVALMGPTGSGKSSFIELATGILGKAGHSLQSFTNKISVIKFPYPPAGVNLYFVDTPGFDDTNKSDLDIFKMISKWLSSSYKKDIRLTGLLYFHRISDNRMAGTALKNFHLFEQLCGKDFSNIVLTTTMWGEVEEWVGAAREEELKRDYWRPMIKRGSYVKRFLYSKESAFEILAPFLAEANKRGALLLQKEMNEDRLELKETSAGKALYVELGELVARHKDLLERIRRELRDPTADPDQLQFLMEDYQEAATQLQRASDDMRKLKKSGRSFWFHWPGLFGSVSTRHLICTIGLIISFESSRR